MSRPFNSKPRPEIQARARAIIARVLARPINYDTSEWSDDVPKVTKRIWNKGESQKAKQRAFRKYAREDVARQESKR